MNCSHYNYTMPITFAVIYGVLLTVALANLQLQTDMPMLVQKIRPSIVRPFQIVQQQSFRYEFSLQSTLKSNLYTGCHIHSSYIAITPLISSNQIAVKPGPEYSFHKFQNTVYQIAKQRITAFKINWQTHSISQGDSYALKDDSIKMLQVSQQNKLFVFTSWSVYELEPLSKNQLQQVLKRKDIVQAFKVIRFEELILQISSNQGITIYTIDFSLNLKHLTTITTYHNHTLHIADAYYQQNHLFILDHSKGLFIFKRDSDTFIEMNTFSLQLQEPIQYKLLAMTLNNLYIAFQGNGQSSILQCLFTYSKLLLIRYFKSYDIINKIRIFQNKLLIHSNTRIDLFALNRDPRTITTLLNGYSYSHSNQIQGLFYLQNSQFLMSTADRFQIVTLEYRDPVLQCSFDETGSYQIIIEKECQTNINDPFYRVCSEVQKLDIRVNSASKDSYNWLLLIVIGLFVIGVALLIYWRGEEMLKIQRIFRNIRYFKEKFQTKTEQVQFQEVDHAYSDQLHARSRNWEEIEPESTEKERSSAAEDNSSERDHSKKQPSGLKVEQIGNEQENVATERGLTM